MIEYLLDTNICVFYFRNIYKVTDKLAKVGLSKCAISEITLAELKFGIELSEYKNENAERLELFTKFVSVIPITNAIPYYAEERARLKRINKSIGDFDLLIGATAVVNGWTMVTENEKHLSRIENIVIENWVKRTV